MEELYSEFEKMKSNKDKREFVQSLSADVLYKFLMYLMNKTGLLLSDIMNSLGIWRIE